MPQVTNEENPDNVLDFPPPAPPVAPVALDRDKYAEVIDLSARRSYACAHRARREVDEQARKIVCTACAAELDPYKCLHELAMDWERRHQRWVQLCDDIKAAEARLAQLKRDEANTRARIKRMGLSPKRRVRGIDMSR